MVKSTLALSGLMLAGLSLNAQTVFLNENFESGTATGWTNSTQATDGGWLIGNSTSMSSQYFPIPAHTTFAATNDDECNCNKSADRYMTPVLNLSGATSVHLKFDVYYGEGSYNNATEDLKVVISTAGTTGTFTTIYDVPANFDNWETYTVDLSSYAGQSNVVVGFLYNDDGDWLYGAAIDNVMIFEPNQYDASMTGESMAEYLLLSAAPFNVTGTFINMGSATLTSVDFNYSVNGGATVTDAGNTVSVASLATGTYSHGTPWTPSASGVYTIKAWLSNLNGNADQDMSNDTLSWIVNVVDTMINRNALMEVFTSSTCGPCAPGNANMENNVIPNISNYTVIKYQQDFPGAGDPYSNTESVGRRNYYAINSIPRMEIDGQWDGNANSLTTSIFNSYQAEPSFMSIDITKAEYFTNSDKMVKVDAVINPVITYPAGTYRYHVVITEKKTVQNVASNGETEFLNVMMKMIPNQNGNTISALTQNTPINVSKVQFMTGTNVEEMSDLRVVVFVQDNNTKKILQSAWADLILSPSNSVSEVTGGDLPVRLFPNPAGTETTVSFDSEVAQPAKIRIVNAVGQVVAEETISAAAGTNTHAISTAGLAGGVYFVSIVTGTETGTIRLVVNN